MIYHPYLINIFLLLGMALRLTEFPERTYPEDATPAEITKHCLDQTYVLDHLIKRHNRLLICFIIYISQFSRFLVYRLPNHLILLTHLLALKDYASTDTGYYKIFRQCKMKWTVYLVFWNQYNIGIIFLFLRKLNITRLQITWQY